MKALVLEQIKQSIQYKEVANPIPAAGEVLVKIRAAALNHRDVYITQGLYPAIVTPCILGSDGVGEVIEIGDGVNADWLGKRVILNPNNHWGNNPRTQSKNYYVLGMPENGTLAEYIKIKADRLALAPSHLEDAGAAALPLAGLTGYRALIGRAQAQKNDKVLITGIGGGVALFVLQFAIAIGAEVYVTSGSDEKIAKAMQLGTKGGANYKQADWAKQLAAKAGGFDVVIDSAGGEGFGALMDLANPGGRIAFYGGTHGSFKVSPQKVFWKQLSLLGCTMGTDQEFEEMVALVQQHQIQPVIDSIWTLEQGAAAFEHMDKGQQFGKIVLMC